MYDVIVVGGGPAGMTAALYARRNGKTALVIEKNGFGGQMTFSPKIENFPGTLQVSGLELADQMMEQIIAQGADFEIETVTGVEQVEGGFVVKTEEEAKAVDPAGSGWSGIRVLNNLNTGSVFDAAKNLKFGEVEDTDDPNVKKITATWSTFTWDTNIYIGSAPAASAEAAA